MVGKACRSIKRLFLQHVLHGEQLFLQHVLRGEQLSEKGWNRKNRDPVRAGPIPDADRHRNTVQSSAHAEVLSTALPRSLATGRVQ